MRFLVQNVVIVIFLAIFLINCGGGNDGGAVIATPDGNVGTTPGSRMFNIETVVTRSPGVQYTEIFQILFEGEIIDNANISCSVISPYVDDPTFGGDYQNCTVDSFIKANNILTANFDLGGEPAVLNINLNGTSPYSADFDDNSFTFTGNAREVSTELRIRTQRHDQGYNFSAASILNPNPNYQKAELVGAATTNIILWDNSLGNDGTRLYENRYKIFLQSDTFDGKAQRTGALVSHNTNNGATSQLYTSDRLQVIFSQHVDPAIANLTLALDYDRTLDPASLFSGSNPPKLSDIKIEGVPLTDATTATTAAEIGIENYTITWPDTTTDPQNTRWRLRLIAANDSTIRIFNRKEVRTKRLQNGDVDGPTLTQGVWSWTVPDDFIITRYRFGLYKLYLRASNAERSLTSQTQAAFITTVPPL